ncbi:GerAB/ArcD/ProY family transporter [Paenibacillus sp. GYB003]|uniref:GerAB/ArcD/ProY family transporter n=1 Tax=Paenibacillus sp. GYB003 TaxID=2994392 RepID=UPI002F96895C
MGKSLHVATLYVLSHLGLIFFLYPGSIIASVTEGFWAPILFGFVVHVALLSIYMKGLSHFPKKDLIRIYSDVGKRVSAVFLLPVAFYLLIVGILTVRAYSEIITIVFLSDTPLWAIMALLLAISTYIAAKGIETICRTGILLAVLFLPIVLFVFFASFQNADWRYAVPLFDIDFSFLRDRSYWKSFFAFAGGFLFLGFVQPFFSYDRSKVLIAAAALLPFFLFSVYIPALTFGRSTASTFLFPYVVALDAIQISWLLFDRLTMFFLLSLVTFLILFLALVMWKTVRIANRYIPSSKPAMLVLPLAALIFIVCLTIPSWNDVERLFWWNTLLRLYIMIAVPASVYYFGVRSKRKVNHANV